MMRQHSRLGGSALFALGLGLLVVGAGLSGREQSPSLAGSWKLNAEKSDKAEDKIREAARGDNLPPMPEGRSRAGRGGVGGGRRGGGGDPAVGGAGGSRGEGGSGGGGREDMGPLMLYMRPLQQLVVRSEEHTSELQSRFG